MSSKKFGGHGRKPSCTGQNEDKSGNKGCSESETHAVVNMKLHLTKSLYWYVQSSLEDMLSDYMEIGRKKPRTPEVVTERADLVTQMFELPLEYDSVSRQIASDIVIKSIQRNLDFVDGCASLMVGISTIRRTVSDTIKGDFLSLLEEGLFREQGDETPASEMEKSLCEQIYRASTNGNEVLKRELIWRLRKLELPNLKKSRKYAKMVAGLYRKRYLSATQVLVYLDKLSRKPPNHYFADILLLIVLEIGADVESKVRNTSRSESVSLYGRPSSYRFPSSSDDNPTLDAIYSRLKNFCCFALLPKTIDEIHAMIEERYHKKSKKSDGLRNTSAGLSLLLSAAAEQEWSFNSQSQHLPASSSQAQDGSEIRVDAFDVEATTAL